MHPKVKSNPCSFKYFLRLAFFILLVINITGCKSCNHNSDNDNNSADGAGDNTSPTTSYSWDISTWGECSEPCGGGIQQRTASCQDEDGIMVDDSLCTESKPDIQQPCNTRDCPPTYTWYEGECTDCVIKDGRCKKACDVYCRSSNDEKVDDALCTEVKPAAEILCEESLCADEKNVEVYRWLAFQFGDCSVECGGGKQYRTVFCVAGSTGETVDDTLCDPDTKPLTELDCNPNACGGCDSRVSEQPGYWPTSGWQTAAIESQGFPAGAFDNLNNDLATDLPYVTSLMIVRDGYVLHETYQTSTNGITGYSNADKFFVWEIEGIGFQRISWIDATVTPVTFQMHVPAFDPLAAVAAPIMPGADFDMTRVQTGSPGGIEVAGIWSGTEGAFSLICGDISGNSTQYFITINNDQLNVNCGSPVIDADSLHTVFSVTKSVTDLTIGAAWQNGLIDLSSLSISVDNAFPGLITDFAADDGRRDISLLDALHMRSGLEWNEVQDTGSSNNPMVTPNLASCVNDDTVTLCSILHMPLAYPPGTMWNYSENDSYLVSAFFHHLTGQSLRDYADQNIFSLIGMTFDTAKWANVPVRETNTEYTNGGAGLFLKTRDMARLGLLTLYDGCWDAQQLVSYDWLQLSHTPIGPGLVQIDLYDSGLNLEPPEIADIQYGLHWWLSTGPGFRGAPVINARGLGGQFIYVFKDMEMVIVVTSNTFAAPVETGFLNRNQTIWNFLQIKILNKMINGTMVDTIEVAGDWTGTDGAVCVDSGTSAPIPFLVTISDEELSFTCDGITQTGDIVRYINAENYLVWQMPDSSFQRFSWVDETTTPVTFQMHIPAGDVESAAGTAAALAFDMTKIN